MSDAPKPSLLVTIGREFAFASAHHLTKLPAAHKCSNVHGHSYRAWVFIRGPVDPMLGWVKDFGMVDLGVKQLLAQLDHHDLNTIPGLEECPTAEMLALWIFKRVALIEPLLFAVEVREESHSVARVEREP